ncbi:unnamed protein product, partial [Brachionus calyciflorus]
MSQINAKKDPGPIKKSIKTPGQKDSADKNEPIVPLDDKLRKLQKALEKSFKPDFIDSLIYFVKIEHQDQTQFDTETFNWQKLDHFMQQLKKMIKNKTHIFMLSSKVCITPGHHRKIKHEDDLSHDSHKDHKDYSVLINDYSSSQNQIEYFSLTQILIRLLFKFFKLKQNLNDILKPEYDINQSKNLYDTCLILLSSLADLCYYEEIRIQVIHDPNLKCAMEIFASISLLELEVNFKRKKQFQCVQLMQKFWSKMCRLCANISQEKSTQKVKNLFTKDFMVSLSRCLDQHQVFLVSNPEGTNTELDLDFYHSLVRFLKYASELANCSKLIIQNRVIVHLCVYMYKLNKNVSIMDNENKKEPLPQTSETTSLEPAPPPILLNKKHYPLFKDLIKQFLILIDSWPTCSEFYNQIIEGLLIEHLLWIQTTPINNLTNSKEAKTDLKFDYFEFSFNLLYKLCRDYHACRAEFGRVGGLIKYLQKIETMTPNVTPNINKTLVNFSYLKEYTILIDIICLACKESVNRLRFKDQGYLLNLIKLQQKLKQNKDEINKFFKNDSTSDDDKSFIDSTLYNKILVALCCFAHDQDSMNILLNNSLIDCLLGYVNEGLELLKKNSSNDDDEKVENFDVEMEESKFFSIKKLLNLSEETSIKINSKKRKTLDSIGETSQKPKRVNSELSSILSASPPFVPSTFPTNDFQNFQATSPTESYLSLSPNFFITASPPQLQSRCSSAQIFQGLSPNFYSTLSPSTSNEILSSPSYFNFNEEQQESDVENQIKFSPSINDDTSSTRSDLEEEEEQEEIIEKSIKNENEQKDEDQLGNLSQNIECINHTEACVFYVLSQLSHGDKPSNFLLQNFDSIVTCLLNYLKKATVRNPRALRILNRLTKNQYCFQHFVLNSFPLKLKDIFYDSLVTSKKAWANRSKKSLLKRSKSFGGNLERSESKIEKEMNTYLNSNKAFFDATSFFPSFQSIEFILINNLKLQCISSSDSGYLTLISLAKQKKSEKLSSALVAPFILRNSKALNYILVQLNNLDLVLDSLLISESDDKSKFKSILCINRILSFINFKRDLNQVKNLYDQIRLKLGDILNNVDKFKDDKIVTFKFDNDEKEIKAYRNLVSKKSEYFNALLNGPFLNSDLIEIKDSAYDTFTVILDILNCRFLNEECVPDHKINFDMCLDLIMAFDRFMLNDLKELFICILVLKYMAHGNVATCFKLAWYLNSNFLANAIMDFVLSEYISDSNLISDDDN